MLAGTDFHLDTGAWRSALMRGVASWWHMIRFAAIVLVLALSPSTYNRTHRAATSRHIYTSTWQVLPWFTALAALLSLVLIRIVVVTAFSYGLSQYALQMVVRVLVLELIPLSAALFVALRSGLTFNANATSTALRPDEDFSERTLKLRHAGSISLNQLRVELVPRVLADAFSVLTLALLSSVIALVLAYLVVYGLSPWGLPGYTRSVGQVFDPLVTLGFFLKSILFSLAVAVVPMAASLEAPRQPITGDDTVQPGAVRLFLVLLLIEAASLVIKYI
jgi:phospholipid/cholesterol/gamma-HCH transport system permease protein